VKIIITESQYNKLLIREFGEPVIDIKKWFKHISELVNSPKDLQLKTTPYEVSVYNENGDYLGYYDKEQGFGYVMDIDDEDELLEQEEGGEETSSGGSSSKWEDFYSLNRGPSNTLDDTPWSVSPTRGPSNTLDNTPWSVSPTRGISNQLT
jgi:hypothetical protein